MMKIKVLGQVCSQLPEPREDRVEDRLGARRRGHGGEGHGLRGDREVRDPVDARLVIDEKGGLAPAVFPARRGGPRG